MARTTVAGMELKAPHRPFRVLIAGGGFAAVEAMLALRALAGARATVTLVAPDPVFHYRPAATLEKSHSKCSQGYDLRAIALETGARYRRERLEAVLPREHRIRTTTGAQLDYDALILCTGAHEVAGIPGASLFRDQRDTPMIRRLLAQVAARAVRSIAFAVPSGYSWPLPAYELALGCAGRASQNDIDAEVFLVTPERTPLEVFGPRSSRHVAELLAESGVRFIRNTTPTAVRRDGTLDLAFAGPLKVDRVVAVPALRGRRISGVPASWWGFVPVDGVGRVEGLSDVYAAGDMTTFPVKNGGLAAHQADRVAHTLAGSLGAPMKEEHQPRVLQAVLAGGPRPLLLRTELDWQGRPTAASLEHTEYHWAGPLPKVFGRYLTPYLEALEPVAA